MYEAEADKQAEKTEGSVRIGGERTTRRGIRRNKKKKKSRLTPDYQHPHPYH